MKKNGSGERRRRDPLVVVVGRRVVAAVGHGRGHLERLADAVVLRSIAVAGQDGRGAAVAFLRRAQCGAAVVITLIAVVALFVGVYGAVAALGAPRLQRDTRAIAGANCVSGVCRH